MYETFVMKETFTYRFHLQETETRDLIHVNQGIAKLTYMKGKYNFSNRICNCND